MSQFIHNRRPGAESVLSYPVDSVGSSRGLSVPISRTPVSSDADGSGEGINSSPRSGLVSTSSSFVVGESRNSAEHTVGMSSMDGSTSDPAVIPSTSLSPDARNVSILSLSTPLGLLSSAQADLLLGQQDLKAAIQEVKDTFPPETQAGIETALTRSTERIVSSLDSGRITREDAVISMEMMREMLEGLADLRTGNAVVVHSENHGDNVKVWNIRSPDGDEFLVSTRLEQDDQGEARWSIRHTVDDNVALTGRYRMALRMDLERWGTPSVDVQFGESALDKKVHGLYKNPDGSVFTTPSGKQLADHHFREYIPGSLSDPTVFADMVKSFAHRSVESLPTLRESVP